MAGKVPRYGLTQDVFQGNSSIGTFRHQILVGGLDLTNYVLNATVRKSIAEPVGTWTIYLRPVVGENNVINRIPVDINDLIEIRIDRKISSSGPIRLVMRGFLDNEEIVERPDQNLAGAPSRSHMLSGSDIGKMLAARKIYVPPDVSEKTINTYTEQKIGMFDDFSAAINKGLELKYDAAELSNPLSMPLSIWADFFLMHVYADEYTRIVRESRTGGTQEFRGVSLDVNLPMMDYKGKNIERLWVTLSPLINNQTGSMWQFIEYYCTKPFVELFLEDDEVESKLKLRWTPHKAKRGLPEGGVMYEYPKQGITDKPWFDEKKIEKVTIHSTDIVERRLRRSEGDRYTYFFTNFNSFMIQNGIPIVPTTTDTDDPGKLWINPYYDEAGIRQFGYRPLIVYVPWFANQIAAKMQTPDVPTTNQVPDDVQTDITVEQTTTETGVTYTSIATATSTQTSSTGSLIYTANGQVVTSTSSIAATKK